MTSRRPASIIAVAGLALVAAASGVLAHNERPCTSPPRPGSLPDANRKNPNQLVVCKPSSRPSKAQLRDIQARLGTDPLAPAQLAAWRRNSHLFRRCRFEHIQEAANAAGDNTDILVLPGVYREEPSRAAPTSCNSCGDQSGGTFSYEFQAAHPNDQNLVGIVGKKNITLEGTGVTPDDVLIDAGFVKDVGVRCDRCEGFIVRNLTEQDANEHGVYVIESDGYIYDHVIGRYNKDYELFSFASDHGLFTDSESIGGSDSGFYVGGAPNTCGPNTEGRINTVLRRCKMHHNALGFSGTQGNCVEITESDIYDNTVGISFDAEQDHPNFPLNHCLIDNNDIHDNNFDIYAPPVDPDHPGHPENGVPPGGPAYSTLHYPAGTGLWIVAGQSCVVMGNRIWNNNCYGAMLFPNPLETGMSGAATIDGNMHLGNVMGAAAGGPNGTSCGAPGADFFWEGSGTDNCWQDNGAVTTDPGPPRGLPDCSTPNAGVDDPENIALLASCVIMNGQTVGPCAFGTTNNGAYENGDEAQCGNGFVDRGEDCDQYGTGTIIPSESCDSLGYGPGTLGCTTSPRACTWDTSGCAAPACSEYGASLVRLFNVGTPASDDELRFKARGLAGASFDPRTEDVSLVFRDQGGAILIATIPGGSAGWTATPSSSPTTYGYNDPAGTLGGIVQIVLRATPSFTTGFRALVDVRGRDLGGATDALAGTAVLRVGNDCWSDTTPCAAHGAGVLCRGRTQP